MFLIFVGQLLVAVWVFGIALIMMILSLGISIYEIQISVKALNLHLSDMEHEDTIKPE
jgi:cell division protein FtsL